VDEPTRYCSALVVVGFGIWKRGDAKPLLGSQIASGVQTIPASFSTFTRRSVP